MTSIYGYLAEFKSPEELIAAARTVREKGYRKFDAFTPFPVHELDEAMGIRKTILPTIVFGGGLLGLLSGFLLQVFVSKIDYPLNVGGRPLISWPSFIPVTFELTILFAGIAAVVGMFALNKLPQPYHPLFNSPSFEGASRDKFFLVIESSDALFDESKTKQFLSELHAIEVTAVET